jgi:NADPH:quinone reductase-like Zn-dependent oxidoreductase
LRAAIYTSYGPPEVLELKEVDRPVPKDDEVLIEVHATTVSPMDTRFRDGKTFLTKLLFTGFLRPKIQILGVEFAGVVESVGKDVEGLKKGDEVYGGGHPGAYAEFGCFPEKGVVIKPTNMTFEEAAAVPFGAVTAYRYLKDLGNIQEGQRVLINGASGGLGTFGVQIAKHYGTQVTAVCSTANLDLVRSLGADDVVDHRKEDFTRMGRTYDIIFDAVGKSTFSKCKGSLEKRGRYLNTVLTGSLALSMMRSKIGGSKKARWALLPIRKEDLDFLNDLIEAGKMRTVIDRTYTLDQIVEAHRYAERGHAKGKVVVTIE